MGKSKEDKQLTAAPASGVDNTFRRIWDKDEFTAKADEREKQVRKQYV